MCYIRNYTEHIYKIFLLKIKPQSDQASSNKHPVNTGYEEHIKWQQGGIITKSTIFWKLYRTDDPVSLTKKIKKRGVGRRTDL